MLMTTCDDCRMGRAVPVFILEGLPVFQNKVYDSEKHARRTVRGTINLHHCDGCGLIFNSDFDPEIAEYDSDYDNDQMFSDKFTEHIFEVKQILKNHIDRNGTIAEIGCGQGVLLESLKNDGYVVSGYDPAYKGKSDYIVRDYFRVGVSGFSADLIILRHVIEHVPCPFTFLQTIARANRNAGAIYIETPVFDWIYERGAFWDLFYEHCNYFPVKTLKGYFNTCRTGFLFGGQYMYLTANLKDLTMNPAGKKLNPMTFERFRQKIQRYQDFVKTNPGLIVWGAAAKGVSFINLTDPDKKYIDFAIDINPRKQGKFVPGTGHSILSPVCLNKFSKRKILIMNENYEQEIRKTSPNNEFIVLGNI